MKFLSNRAALYWIGASVLILTLLAFPLPARAMVEDLTFSQLVEYADIILIADVSAVNSHWNESHTLIVTDITLEVQEVLKGKILETPLTLQQDGGKVGDYELWVSDSPTFEAGEKTILFLYEKGLYPVGAFQGKFTIIDDTVQGINVPVDRFRTRVMDIMETQRNGVPVDFDWNPESETLLTPGLAGPQITGITPTWGPSRGLQGSCPADSILVTIIGYNFGAYQGNGRVTLPRDGATNNFLCIISWSNTKIVARIPGGSSSGNISVIGATGYTSNGIFFSVPYAAGYRWRTGTVTYKVNPNSQDLVGEERVIQTAAKSWTDAANGWFRFRYGGLTHKVGLVADSENVISWGYVPKDRPAVTYNHLQNGQLVESDMVFNNNPNEGWVWGNDGSVEKMDLQNVATHEFGHMLMLDDLMHFQDRFKTMYGPGGPGQTNKRSITPEDIQGLLYLYQLTPGLAPEGLDSPPAVENAPCIPY